MKPKNHYSETTAKERILKKLRKALLEKSDNPYHNLEETSLYPPLSDPLELVFAQQFLEVGGQFVFCEDDLDLIENLLALIEKDSLRRIYAWEPKIQKLLSNYDFPFYSTDTDFEKAELGITTCEALIARNGSILISNANASGRRLSIYPHVHLVIAYTSQLLPDIKDGMAMIKKKYGENLPSMVSLITGPSRTADIQKTLVLGAHGPREIYVFLVDDSIMPKQ